MKEYTFFDRDYYRNSGEQWISGEHFETLLAKCFLYSKYVALTGGCNKQLLQLMKTWQVNDLCADFLQKNRQYTGRVFYANEETHRIVSAYLTNLFEDDQYWTEPVVGDITFLREDLTCLFETILHEGECSLYLHEDEDFSDVVCQEGWLLINGEGKPEIPAKDVNLPMASFCEIQSDFLFAELQRMKCDENRTIEDLCEYLTSYRPLGWKDVNACVEELVNFLPRWFVRFEFFILAKCNALTTTQIADALKQAGYTGTAGTARFYELLEEYVEMSKVGNNSAD